MDQQIPRGFRLVRKPLDSQNVLPPFGSDNYAPAHPEVLSAIAAANTGFATAYGDDDVTARFKARVEEVFGTGAHGFPVINGTGANVISMMAMTTRYAGVITADVAHANTDENGAPERVGGVKLLTRPTTDGKLTPDDVESWTSERGDVHRAQPELLSLTQATELGTVYSVEELRALVDIAHTQLHIPVHVDGSRLTNAAAHLGVDLHALTAGVGVDIISLGAAKNGGLLGEAVVVMSPDDAPCEGAALARRRASEAVPYLVKSTMQLASKARFISAQLLAMLGEPGSPVGIPTDERGSAVVGHEANGATAPGTAGKTANDPLWLRNARAANARAEQLAAGVTALGHRTGIRISRPVQANAVFATLPRTTADRLREQTKFYDWSNGETPDRVEVRWMCSWNTTEDDVNGFLRALMGALASA